MNAEELVTVVIPAFNAESFIEYSIKSCLAQTHRPTEVMVVNDGSTDSTANKARELTSLAESQGVELNILHVGKNQGTANALNLGFSKAKGSFVCWLSADDMFIDRKKLEKQVDRLRKTNAFWSYCDGTYVGETPSNARIVRGSYLPRLEFLNGIFIHNPLLRLMALLFRNPINGSSVMIRKDRGEPFGQFDPITKNVDPDSDLWMRYSALGLRLVVIRGGTIFYRDHPTQTSKKKRLMIYGSELTRIRMLETLEKEAVLSSIIKQFAPYLPITFLAHQQFSRPFVSEFLLNHITTHKREFAPLFVKFVRKSMNSVVRHPNYLMLNKSEFLEDLKIYRDTKEFKKFEGKFEHALAGW